MLKPVKRATQAEKEAMRAIVDAHNEIEESDRNWEVTGLKSVYSLQAERVARRGYVIVNTMTELATGEVYVDRGGFYRCSECGEITDFFDGELDMCPHCGARGMG
jgi:rRNA maturation endonuclease Nob1